MIERESGASELAPGFEIAFANLDEVHEFEEVIAPLVQDKLDTDLWSTRVPLKNLLRPSSFNGRLEDVTLTVMDSPYERLMDTGERGFKLAGGYYKRTSATAQDEIDKYIGFSLHMSARSSRKGVIGQVSAELWYAPINDAVHLLRAKGNALRRIVTRPNFDQGTFLDEQRASRAIAYAAMRGAFARTASTGKYR